MKFYPLPALLVYFSILLSGQGPERIRVLLLLGEQPYADVAASSHPGRLRREMIEARYTRLAGRPGGLDAEFQKAAQALDHAIQEERTAIVRASADSVDAAQAGMEASLKAMGATHILRYQVLNLIRAEIPATAWQELASDPRIAQISTVGRNESQINISARSMGASWFWNGSPTYTGKEQTVAVLDSGINATHPSLAGRVTSSRFLTPGSISCVNPQDYNDNLDHSGHGTHVAGIIASAGTTLLPSYLGVAFQTASVISVKVGCRTADSVLPFLQSFYADDDLLQGLQHAITQTPARVVNISMGRRDNLDDSLLNRSIDSLADIYGITIVVSAGNLGPTPETVTSPGTAYNVITVGAFNTQGTLERTDDFYAGFSSRGPTVGGRKKPDLAAPGGRMDANIGQRPLSPCPDGSNVCGIYSADFSGSGFVALPGTSMAAAHVSGAALLLRQAGVTNATAIKAILLNATDTVDWNPLYGWGYSNLQLARDQYPAYLLDTLPPAGYKLYRGPANAAVISTLVWNRRISAQGAPSLADLDLSLYNAVDDAKAAESASRVDNVEKAAALTPGDYIVKVRNNSQGAADQPYALALSLRGFAAMSGPLLTVSCQAPYAALPGTQFPVVCAGRNIGDADAFDVKGSLGIQGLPAGPLVSFGNIAPGGRVTRNWTITAPAAGSYTLRGELTSSTFGETFRASTSAVFYSTTCSFRASGAPITFPAQGGSGTVAVSTEAGCPVTVTSNSSWITVNAGPGTITYAIAVNPGVQRTGSINAAGEVIQILQRAAAPTSAFTDVPVESPFSDAINLLRQNNVTSGCTQTAYCPDDYTTRGQMAVFIVRSVLGTDIFPFPLAQIFDDVGPSHPFFKYIQKLKEFGITSGCTVSNYCPDMLLSRGQMAVFIVRGRLGINAAQEFPYKTTPYFQDVPATHPFFSYIQKMRELGITSGCAADRYCPGDWTTRGQMAIFLIRGFYTP